MKPELMEALQMLKFLLKKKHLNFMEGWKIMEDALIEDDDRESGLDSFLDATSDLASRNKVLESLIEDDKHDYESEPRTVAPQPHVIDLEA